MCWPSHNNNTSSSSRNNNNPRFARVMGWRILGSNRGGGDIFRTCSDLPWDPTRILYNGYRVAIIGVRRPGPSLTLTACSAEVKERIKLPYNSPTGPPWPVVWWPLPSTLLPSPLQVCSFLRTLNTACFMWSAQWVLQTQLLCIVTLDVPRIVFTSPCISQHVWTAPC